MADSGSSSRVVYVLLVVFSLFQLILSKRSLQFVSLVYRHGDRSPFNVYGNDTNTEDTWPQGFQQLTQVGMRQQYELGQFFKTRYVSQDFLNSSYNRHQIQVWSTDSDRTLMSAQANLVGLFPPDGQQVWNPDIRWQPIPVHTKPIEEDVLLRMPPCPRYQHLLKDFQTTDPEYLRMEADNQDFFKNLTSWTGLPGNKGLSGISKVVDSLFCERAHNRTFPDWATPEVYDKLLKLKSYMIRASTDRERNRLLGGPLLGAMVNNMTHAKEGTLQDGRLLMIMYSAHDSTLSALLSAMGTFNFLNPPYCACVMVELYQEDSGDWTVEVWYRNDSSHTPYLLTVPGCPNPCSYQQFLNATKDSIVTDRARECHLGIFDQWKTRIPVIAGVAVLVVVAIVAMMIGVYVRRSRQRKQHKQHLISEDKALLTNTDENEDVLFEEEPSI